MTRKDFELIAKVLSTRRQTEASDLAEPERLAAIDCVIEDFGNALSQTNNRFDKKRFVEACKR
jgi:hypothetical protein